MINGLIRLEIIEGIQLIFNEKHVLQNRNTKIFIKAQICPVLILLLSSFLCLEKHGDDLCQAVKKGDLEKVEQLLSLGVSPNVHGARKFNRTPLHIVATYNSTEVAKRLLQRNADIEARDKKNRTPLHEAARHDNLEVAELLFQHSADIEARDKSNGTPLHSASCGNSTEVANLLLQNNADIEARDKNKKTPLHSAAGGNNTEVTELLV